MYQYMLIFLNLIYFLSRRSEEKKEPKPKAGKRGVKKNFKGMKNKSGAKPTGGKGQRNPNKRNLGRKRR